MFVVLFVIIPAFPVLAAAEIDLSRNSGVIGSSVTVHCTGFTAPGAGFTNNFFVYFDGDLVDSGDYQDTDTSFTASFNVPSVARGNPYSKIEVVTENEAEEEQDSVSANFEIIPEITLSPTSGYVGDSIKISGKGFAASDTISFYFDDTATGPTTKASSSGTFSNVNFPIPASTKGTHTLEGKDDNVYSDEKNFSVSSKVTVNPTSGGVGDKITITGTGFAANQTIGFFWDDNLVSGESASTDGKGGFTTSIFTVPMTPRGNHVIKAQDGNSNESTVNFSVAQRITMSPTSGVAGTIVAISGNGFLANTAIRVKYGTATVTTNPATINTNNNGTFSGTFTVPAGAPGPFNVEVSDGTYSTTASFTATFDATISVATTSSAPGIVGMEITLSGLGFKPNAPVTVTYAPENLELSKTLTDASGTFSVKVTIPPIAGGDHTIRVSDGTTSKDFPFYMEKTAPAVPELLSPITTAKVKVPKAKNLAVFDWKDVTDPSGFTYTLQIATDANFTKPFEKKGLTKSEYTLTEAEKLPSNKSSTPYYWRVKAVDRASNESAWSVAQPFNVGFSLELTGWVLYVALGIGGLLLFLIGFFLGSRRSLSY